MSKVDGVGVAFCGGGFRSYAEVAVVENLAREGITIGAVAGTSMGSLVAALVGAGSRRSGSPSFLWNLITGLWRRAPSRTCACA